MQPWYRSLLVRLAIILAVLVGVVMQPVSGPWVPVFAHNGSSPQDNLAAVAQVAQVSPFLQKELERADGPVSFLVMLNDQLDAPLLMEQADVRAASQQSRVALLYNQLTRHAQSQQANLRAWLDAKHVAYRPFYIINMLEVTGDATLAQALSRRPEVARLVANPRIRAKLLATSSSVSSPQPKQMATFKTIVMTGTTPVALSVPYGLANTNAPDVWALGYEGQGIVVASQDTGVEWDHPALKAQYRGWNATDAVASHTYNWFDAWGDQGRPSYCSTDAQTPCDDHGHGTHTVGTMLGKEDESENGILGMAPKAKWIGCRNMEDGVGTPASYIACFEFMLAPYPQNGNPETDGHPELAPNIINNSWGCPPSEGCDADSLKQIVETMRSAGIMVVASAGNDGSPSASGCQTVKDPIAIYDAVFSVGAHDVNGNIASFSSRGPVTIDGSNRPKPDITAPGVDVYSAWLTNSFFNGHRTASGTSMASPHMVGAIALLWSAEPRLIGQIDQTEQILIKSATPVPFNQCGEVANAVPNMTYGYGHLDILAAVKMAQAPAALTIHIDGVNAKGVANAQATVIDQLTGYSYTATSNSAGDAIIPALYQGNYTVQINATDIAFGATEFQIIAGETKEISILGGWPVYMPIIARN